MVECHDRWKWAVIKLVYKHHSEGASHYYTSFKMMKSLCLLLLIVTVSCREIPEGFIGVGEDYILSTSTLDYLQAFATCKRYGKTLVTERNQAETLKFNSVLNEAGLAARSFWIGAVYQRDVEFAPEWIWLENGQILTYTNWYTTPSASYYCLRKYPSATYSGKWSAENCATAFYFACKNK